MTVVSHSIVRWLLASVLLLSIVIIPFILFEAQIDNFIEQLVSLKVSRVEFSVLVAAALAFDVVLPVPSSILNVAAGAALGFGVATLVCWIGMTLGCAFGYWIGATGGTVMLRKVVGEDQLRQASDKARSVGATSLVMARAVPVLAEASCIAAGAAKYPFSSFLTAIGLANVGVAASYAAIGAWAFESNGFLIAIGGAICIPAAAMIVHRGFASNPKLRIGVHTTLLLGRVSNLPTVWTNALAAIVLVGGVSQSSVILLAGLALTSFYIGGMWLNDAFDAEIDAKERPERPIPQGLIARRTTFIGGFAFLILGIGLASVAGPAAGGASVALAAVIVLYDWSHKHTVLSPVIMGAARFLSYLVAGLAVATTLGGTLLLGALGLFAYVVGLTYAAKQEAYDRIESTWPLWVLAIPLAYAGWLTVGRPEAVPFLLAFISVIAFALFLLFRRKPGDVPKAVITLIAGISIYDAVLIAAHGNLALAVMALFAFGLTLILQRLAPGT